MVIDNYISREEVVEKIKSCISVVNDAWDSGYNTAMEEIMEWIKHMPTADVQPVKHSHWFYPFSELDVNRCWECGMYVQDKINNVREMFKYCPGCGARMDGDLE